MFRDNLSVPTSRAKKCKKKYKKKYKKKDFLILEDRTDRLSRNVSIELPFYSA
jgi:hypothetical protein